MRKKSTASSGYINPRALVALIILFGGLMLALFVKANPGPSPREHLGLSQTSPFTPGGIPQEVWVARYNGSDNSDDEATALAIDGSGNVYVTGFSFDPNTDYDYTTIKYNSAGQQQWIARYDGPENYTDQATAIAVDASGNVYVTGASSSNAGSLDYTTIKYNSAGQQQWAARYDGPGNDDDVPRAIVVDGSGNVYVTGYSFGSGFNHDFATIKYNSAGQPQWVRRYDGPGADDDNAAAVAVDAAGNVYVAGGSYGSGFNLDYATIKYNSAGQQQWVARYDGPINLDDEARAMAIDGAGNICVTGYSTGSVDYDYATIKYNLAGQQLWLRRYDGPGHSDDVANAMAVDPSGYIYVTGYSTDSAGDYDYSTIKYDASGQQQWVARYDGLANLDDEARAITVDGSGSVYVTGITDAPPFGFGGDYATVKYTSSGQEEWVARYEGSGNYIDQGTAIALDDSGDIVVTGYSFGSDTDFDYTTIKYVQELTPTPTPTPSPTSTPGVTPRPRPTPP
jgi:uncharacterized delta-60 repeat protein